MRSHRPSATNLVAAVLVVRALALVAASPTAQHPLAFETDSHAQSEISTRPAKTPSGVLHRLQLTGTEDAQRVVDVVQASLFPHESGRVTRLTAPP
jgi:hypothetical protein